MLRLRKTIRVFFWLIVPILVLTLGLAFYFYPEEYRFVEHYISQLGGQFSYENNYDNLISSIIMSVGFGFCAFITIIISILYFSSNFNFRNLKGSFCLIIAFGAILTAIPEDKGNLLILHTIGAVLFIIIFGVLNFTLQLLRFVRKRQEFSIKKSFDFYLDATVVIVVFLVIVILSIFFLVSEITGNSITRMLSIIFQKLVLIVSCFAILLLDLDDI